MTRRTSGRVDLLTLGQNRVAGGGRSSARTTNPDGQASHGYHNDSD